MTKEDIIIRVLLSTLIGALIGQERKQSGKPAGITTHLVVCLGATILTLIQKQLYLDMIEFTKNNPDLVSVVRTDITRIPAQIVSGIGFLGGGVILHSKDSISGITTAGTIWITACLGIGIGYGYYPMTLLAAVVLLAALYTLKVHNGGPFD